MTINTDIQSFLKRAAASGWILVPLEPTPEMVEAASDEDGEVTARRCYAAMLEAAPNWTDGDARL